jgi:acetyltransferase-like isoleucine patch superfamily enzyme
MPELASGEKLTRGWLPTPATDAVSGTDALATAWLAGDQWVAPRGFIAGFAHSVRWFLLCLQPRLTLVDLLVRLIPMSFANEVRTQLYRFAGCRLGAHVEIYGRMTLYGDVAHKAANLSIGEGSNCAPFCTFGLTGQIRIGRNVGLAPYVRIFTTQHVLGDEYRRSLSAVIVKPVIIEDGAVVMTGATILPGVTIGRGAIVGAGAVVTRNVEANTFVGGVPAKKISNLSPGPLGASAAGPLEQS